MVEDPAKFEDPLTAHRASRSPGGLAHALAVADRRRRQRRRIILACVGAAVVLIVGSCSVVRLTVLPERQARAAVLDYFEALSDLSSAWRTIEGVVAPETIADVPLIPHTDGTTEPAVRRQLIGHAAMPNLQCLGPGVRTHRHGPASNTRGCYTPPTDLLVTDVTVRNDEAQVSVEYGFQGDDRRYPASLRLRRETGPVGTIKAEWRILDAFGTLVLSPMGGGCQFSDADNQGARCVTLDGFPVEDMAGPGSRATVLPGRHQVEVHLLIPSIATSLGGWQATVFTVVVPPGAEVVPEPVT